MIKNPLFFTINNKNGVLLENFKFKWPYPESDQSTGGLEWQRANARANLWWRHEPFPGETSIALRPGAGKAGVAKRIGDTWVSFHPKDVVNLAWQVRFGKKFTFNRAQDVVR